MAAKAARPAGRPHKPDCTKSRVTRLTEDLAEMVEWIARVNGTGVAAAADPLVRGPITARFREIAPVVEQIKAASRGAKS